MHHTDHQKIKEILFGLSENVKNIDCESINISKIVKQIDHAVQTAYTDLYKIIDGREVLKREEQKKHGHCC